MEENQPLFGVGLPNANLPRSRREVAIATARKIWTVISSGAAVYEADQNRPREGATVEEIENWIQKYSGPGINKVIKKPQKPAKKPTEVESIGNGQSETIMPPMWRHDP